LLSQINAFPLESVRFDKKLLKNIINTLFDFSYYTV